MAYRVFRNEPTYEAPNIEAMPRTLNVLSQLQQQKFQQAQQERAAGIQQQKDLADWHYSGKISSHSRAINDAIKNLVNKHIESGAPGLTPETRVQMANIKAYQGKADAIAEELNRLKELEVAKKQQDPYYRPQIDKLEQIVSTAGEGLQGIDKAIPLITEYRAQQEHPSNSVETFNQPEHLADFVKSQGEKQNAVEYTGPEGVKHASDFTSPFYLENGMPGVPNATVTNYFETHPGVKPYYQQKAGEELMKQIQEIKASNPSWHPNESVKDLLPKIMAGEITNPHPEAKPYNQMQFEMARKDIWNQAKVHQKISTDYSNAGQGYQFGIKSKHAAATPGWNDNPLTGAGPAMTVLKTNSSNPYYTFDSEVAKGNKRMVDGQLVDNPYPRNFKLQNFQWGGKTYNGGVYKLKGKSSDELIKEINSLPATEFDPKNPNAIKSSSVIFNGQSVDKKVLDLAYAKRKELDAKIAIDPTDQNAKTTLDKLDQTLEDINAGKDFNDQFLQQLTGTEILHNESFPVDPNDKNSQFLENQTGMNVYSKKAMTPDMMRVKQAIDNRIKQTLPEIKKQQEEQERIRKESNLKKQSIYEENVRKITGGKKPEPKLKTIYRLGNMDYTVEELKNKGYSLDEIKQAVQKGIIK